MRCCVKRPAGRADEPRIGGQWSFCSIPLACDARGQLAYEVPAQHHGSLTCGFEVQGGRRRAVVFASQLWRLAGGSIAALLLHSCFRIERIVSLLAGRLASLRLFVRVQSL